MAVDIFKVTDVVGCTTKKLRDIDDSFPLNNTVEVWFRNKSGEITSHSVQHNLRTNVGADFWNTQLFSTGSAVAQANFIALTTNATAPSATDTTLTSEETTNGLGRTQATVAHTTGATSSVLSVTFTYTGSTSKVIAKVGLFNAASVGTMALETLLASTGTVNANGDQITVQWTVNF